MKRELLRQAEIFQLQIPADENNLSEVRDFIADICLRAGFSKRETNNTKLATDEACTNIIKHAYLDGGGEIRIEVNAGPGRVEINIYDSGTPFEWSQVQEPDLQRYVDIGKKGGLGIYLMNRLMDEVEYQSSTDGNRLSMLKTIPAGTGREPLFLSVRPKWTSTLRFKFALRATLGLLGLVLFLWAVQYAGQTREIEDARTQAWMNMYGLAGTLESKSENALTLDDPFDPEYRELTDYVLQRVMRTPGVRYARVVNSDGLIVSSSNVEEFLKPYDMPDDARALPSAGLWRELPGPGEDVTRELQLPVFIAPAGAPEGPPLGRVVLGVSERAVEAQIHDPRPRMALVLAGIFLIGISLIYMLISVFVKPIQALTDGVRAIGDGSLADGISIEGPEEIGEIARAFNEITGRFREAQKSVVEQERMQKEMQVAQEIQHSLLPGRVPEISGYDIASLYRAAKEVGGDYYDFVNVDDDTLGVVVADVSGKGVPGSLVMTMIRTALRMEARGSHSAADVMSRMNDFVTEDMKKGMFVTIFYLILDSKNRIISYSSAGHNPMILYRAETDETFFLNPRGFPVGISLPDETLFRRSIDVEKIKLKKDDMLVIYTDGVTEAMNERREQYGEERLVALIKKCGRMSPDEFVDALNEDIHDFAGDYKQNDDITVVAIKEKLMADDVLFGIRKKLLDLVEVEGLSVAEACTRMNVSPSTFYRYRRRLSEMGERGLKNKTLREKDEIRRVSIEQRGRLLEIIGGEPRLGAKRIAALFNDGRPEREHLTTALVYDELKRMRLNTYEKRLEYLRRNRLITEEKFQELLSGKAPAETPAPAGQPRPLPAGESEVVEEEFAPAGEAQPALAAQAPPDELISVAADQPQPSGRLPDDVPVPRPGEGGLVEVVSHDRETGVIVLAVRGHLDSNSVGEIEELLEKMYENGFATFVVDLSDVSYISSGGWGIFTGRVKTLRENEGDVILAGMSPEVYDIYELLGFQDIIMHFQHVDEAVDFVQLPFDIRQRRLAEVSGARTAVRPFTRREVGDQALPELEQEPEEGAAWSPLRITAGTVGEAGEITVIELAGVIDTVSSMRLRDFLANLVARGVRKFVIDMSLVEYVSSAGWGVFAARIDEVRRDEGDIKIFGMDPEVDGIFHMLGFDVIMRSFSVLSEAIDDFRRSTEKVLVQARPGGGLGRGKDAAAAADPTVKSPAAAGPAAAAADAAARSPRHDFGLDARRSEAAEAVVVRLSGAIDAATAPVFEERLETALADRPACVVLDLRDLVYISSSGWGVIVKLMQRFAASGTRLALSGMSQPIFRIFRDLGFEPLIPNYLTCAKALEELGAPDVDDLAEPLPPPAADAEDEPSLARRGVEPLQTQRSTAAPSLDVDLDLDGRDGESRDLDRGIRRIGWKEYGRKLHRKDGGCNKRKK